MAIKVIKLVTREEVIGEVSVGDGVVNVENPMLLVPYQDEKSKQIKINFIPYAPFAEAKATIGIYPHAIAADYEPADDITNHYRSAFGSGIQVVPSMGLAGLK
jgi:hypothetical protein